MENPHPSPSPPPTQPDPRQDPALADLSRSLRRAQGGFALFVAACDQPAWRDRCIATLGEELPGSLIATCTAETGDPRDVLPAPGATLPAAIHLIRLELAVPGDESRLTPLRQLNLQRGHWQSLGCPVVMWVPEYLVGLLLRHAPDFADWRSSALFFQPTVAAAERIALQARESGRSFHDEELDTVWADASRREARIAELTARLATQLPGDAPPESAIQADWCLELALLTARSGRLPQAMEWHQRHLAWASASGDPAAAPRAWGRLGNVLADAGQFAAARPAMEQYHRGFALLAASDPANRQWQRNLSVSLNRLGDLAVEQGDGVAALQHYSECNLIATRLAESDPADARWQHDLAVSLNKLGDLAAEQGDRDAALRRYLEATDIVTRLAESDPADAQWQRHLSVSLSKLGDLAVANGDAARALRYATDCNLIATRLVASDPANAQLQRDLSVSLERLGDLAAAQGDRGAAFRHYSEALEIAARLAASDPVNAQWQRDVGVSLTKLGNLALAQGDVDAALRHYSESNFIFARIAATDPVNAQWQRDLSVSVSMLGNLAAAQGDRDAAFRHYSDAQDIAARLAASDPANAKWQRDVAVSHWKLAHLADQQGDAAGTEAGLQACWDVLDEMKRRGLHMDPQMAQVHRQLAEKFRSGA